MPCKIVGGTKVLGNEKSWERKFLGTKGPGSESSQELFPPRTKVPENEKASERKFQGTFVPGERKFLGEKSQERKFPIGTIRSWERKVLGTKSPGTFVYHL